jgi:hypothetical protein
MDGNEKLRPWGFYVHRCIDGHSRLIIYLVCSNNKKSSTVEAIFMAGVAKYGWPSRGRGNYGRENNGAERCMIAHWGELHRAYLRGRCAFCFLMSVVLANIVNYPQFQIFAEHSD